LEYDAFTDMDFNPATQTCIVCPARVAAMYVGMTKAGALTTPPDFHFLAKLDGVMIQADISVKDYEVIMYVAPSDEAIKVVLDHPPVDLLIGEKIINKFLGEGSVCEITDTSVKIDFGAKGVKTFQNPYAFEQGYLRKANI
jgi:hypothetical protein